MRTHDRDNKQIPHFRPSFGVLSPPRPDLLKDIRHVRLHPPRRARPTMQQEHDHDAAIYLRPTAALRVGKHVTGQARDDECLLVRLLRALPGLPFCPATPAF